MVICETVVIRGVSAVGDMIRGDIGCIWSERHRRSEIDLFPTRNDAGFFPASSRGEQRPVTVEQFHRIAIAARSAAKEAYAQNLAGLRATESHA
jgi:hypothetical protein